ncbi:MAG: EpsI family protein [Desulfohalobiaceae bacterium]|nr:EpsI family protein [Desulfohalobiaceae bacterium]
MHRTNFLLTCLLFISTTACITLISLRGEPRVVATNLENLPMHIGSYQAVEDAFPQSVYDALNADLHLYRHYLHPDKGRIDLYIGYYGTAKGGRTGHNPYGCLPGAGWGIIEEDTVTLEPHGYARSVELNALVSQKGTECEVILHWYQSAGDKVLSTGIQQNIQRFIGRVFYNRNDGAFVRISAPTAKKEIEQAQARVKAFALKILPLLPKYWPEEEDAPGSGFFGLYG